MSKVQDIPVDWIDREGSTQSRVVIDEDTVASYAEAIRDGARFPPIVVFYDADADKYWIGDGHHRYWATTRAAGETITAEVLSGGERDAIFYSLRSNHEHGLRRSNDDKRRCVKLMLDDEEWQQWSDVRIAEVCGVSDWLVRRMRDARGAKPLRARKARDGRVILPRGKIDEEQNSPDDDADSPNDPDTAIRDSRIAVSGQGGDSGEECYESHDDADPPNDADTGEVTIEALAEYYRDWVKRLRAVTAELKAESEQATGGYLKRSLVGIKRTIDEAAGCIRQNEPADWCGHCDGEGCPKCFGTGFVTRMVVAQRAK